MSLKAKTAFSLRLRSWVETDVVFELLCKTGKYSIVGMEDTLKLGVAAVDSIVSFYFSYGMKLLYKRPTSFGFKLIIILD